MPTLTLSAAQLTVLGIATIAGSFALNALLLRGFAADFRARLERIESGVSGPRGLLVRVAVLEDSNDRRVGPADRRHHLEEEPARG